MRKVTETPTWGFSNLSDDIMIIITKVTKKKTRDTLVNVSHMGTKIYKNSAILITRGFEIPSGDNYTKISNRLDFGFPKGFTYRFR